MNHSITRHPAGERTEKSNVNVIITVHDKIEFLPHLMAVLKSYQTLRPRIVICYNGEDEKFSADIRVPNLGHSAGDMDLTLRGYDWHKERNCSSRFLKVGVDSWLLDEGQVINIFDQMEAKKCGYAGNCWYDEGDGSLATDIIFADVRFGNVFENFDRTCLDFESQMGDHCQRHGIRTYVIPERVPVHPENRYECKPLCWTMHHSLELNIANLNSWTKTKS